MSSTHQDFTLTTQVRGPRLHMKRLNAPHHWFVHKMGGIFAPRPSQGPHKVTECLPLTLIVRNRLHLARDLREAGMIIHKKNVLVDGKPRTDEGYPAGFMDVIQIPKCKKTFRLLLDTKGRFQIVPISEEEANYKLLKIVSVRTAEKGVYVGHTHDGRNIRFLDSSVRVSDSVKFNLKTGEVEDIVKFEQDAIACITSGKSSGRIGRIQQISHYDGSYTMITLVDEQGQKFITRQQNVFVIGKSTPLVTIPKHGGVKLNIVENRKRRLASIERTRKQ